MRISLLLKREPFARILEKTLQTFLGERFCGEYVVKWHQGKPSWHKSNDNTTWLCNFYLNTIFVPQANKYVLLPAEKEFAQSDRTWRTPLNKIYFTLATSKLLARHFAGASLTISPILPGSQNILIIAGNHHIRVLDYTCSCCFVVKKDKFPRDFFDKEIEIRKEHNFLPTPRLKEISYNNCWYSEDLVIGAPINRLRNSDQAARAVDKVLLPLMQLLKNTLSEENTLAYARTLCDTIIESLDRNKLLHQSEKNTIQQLTMSILAEINNYCYKNASTIIISQTHGDFQPANILKSEEGAWLIDWEYTDRRQIAYDGLVFLLKARSSKGLGERIRQAYEGDANKAFNLILRWPHITWRNKKQRRLYLVLFLLEEISLKLRENGNPLFGKMGGDFNDFIKEIRIAARYLQGDGI